MLLVFSSTGRHVSGRHVAHGAQLARNRLRQAVHLGTAREVPKLVRFNPWCQAAFSPRALWLGVVPDCQDTALPQLSPRLLWGTGGPDPYKNVAATELTDHLLQHMRPAALSAAAAVMDDSPPRRLIESSDECVADWRIHKIKAGRLPQQHALPPFRCSARLPALTAHKGDIAVALVLPGPCLALQTGRW